MQRETSASVTAASLELLWKGAEPKYDTGTKHRLNSFPILPRQLRRSHWELKGRLGQDSHSGCCYFNYCFHSERCLPWTLPQILQVETTSPFLIFTEWSTLSHHHFVFFIPEKNSPAIILTQFPDRQHCPCTSQGHRDETERYLYSPLLMPAACLVLPFLCLSLNSSLAPWFLCKCLHKFSGGQPTSSHGQRVPCWLHASHSRNRAVCAGRAHCSATSVDDTHPPHHGKCGRPGQREVTNSQHTS